VGRGLNIVFDAKQCTAFINHIVIGMQNNALPSSTTCDGNILGHIFRLDSQVAIEEAINEDVWKGVKNKYW
jgi:hypothetical protein